MSRIEFQSGYLAPTYLVSGLLDEFDEDWTKLVRAYSKKLMGLLHKTDPLHVLPDLRKLQSFIWDCWVQWGPSVPVAGSPVWKDGRVALQFGYGDENNSLPLIYCPSAATEAGVSTASTWGDWQTTTVKLKKSAAHVGWAWPVKVTGQLRWYRREARNQEFCTAQRETGASTDDKGWLVFEADAIDHDPDGPLFYSAYIWAIVAICRSTADDPSPDPDDIAANQRDAQRGYRLIHSQEKDQWRCLIPFFQHGNVAEASVFNDIKRELAYKTVDSLVEQLRRARSAGVDWLHFAFVAAYDDNGDSNASPPVVEPPGDSIATLLNQARQERFDHSAAEDKELFAALHFEPNALPSLTACHLPQVVRSYLDQVEEAVRE